MGLNLNGTVTLHFVGGPHTTNVIQTTPGLAPAVWQDVATNVADANGTGIGSGGGIWSSNSNRTFTTLHNTIVAGNRRGTGAGTPDELANKNVEAASAHNLIGDAASAGGLVNGTNGIAVDNGPLAGVSLPGTITFNPVLVLTNTPVTIEVVMFVSAGASMRNFLNVGDGRAVGVGQFGSTAALPSTTPVFDLPTGYSARSLSANIVDNHWLGTAVAVSPVPEPAPVILFTAGCLVLGLRHKFVHRVRPVRPDATRSV